MVKSGTLEKAFPGRENAKDWLTLKIVECSCVPQMDDETAMKLAIYSAAKSALCAQDEPKQKSGREERKRAAESGNGKLTMQEAEEWTKNMINADNTTGPHWTFEQAKQIQAQRKIEASPAEFWAALNATYSDLCQFFKRYGLNSAEMYSEFVKTFWLNDEDAVSDKVGAYYRNVVKHE